MTRSLRKKAEGFTLLELLIVVAIIGVLAALAIPNMVNASNRSKYGRALADTKVIVSQAQLYTNDNPGTAPTLALLQTGAVGTYMATTIDPFTAAGNYQFGATATLVRAWTVGLNGASAAAWDGVSAITSDDVGTSSVWGCSVGASAATYARC